VRERETSKCGETNLYNKTKNRSASSLHITFMKEFAFVCVCVCVCVCVRVCGCVCVLLCFVVCVVCVSLLTNNLVIVSI